MRDFPLLHPDFVFLKKKAMKISVFLPVLITGLVYQPSLNSANIDAVQVDPFSTSGKSLVVLAGSELPVDVWVPSSSELVKNFYGIPKVHSFEYDLDQLNQGELPPVTILSSTLLKDKKKIKQIANILKNVYLFISLQSSRCLIPLIFCKCPWT